MGRLSPHTIYSRDLAKRRFWVRPSEPPPELLMSAPGEGVYLGRSSLLAVPVYWDFHRLANPHFAVVGMTGSGKSYFIKTLITRAWRQWSTPSLILDWAGEYSPWVNAAGGRVVRLGKSQGLNVLDCRPSAKALFGEESEDEMGRPASTNKKKQNSKKSVGKNSQSSAHPLSFKPDEDSQKYAYTPRYRIEQLVTSFKILGELGNRPRAVRLIHESLEDSFKEKRINPDKPLTAKTSAKSIPTLRDALKILKTKQRKTSRDDDASAAYALLEFFCPPGADYFSRQGGLRLEDLVGPGIVSVDLSGLPHEAHRSLAGLTILQLLKERMRSSGWSRQRRLRLMVVADEAWKIAQDERSDLVAIMREGRKYAFGLVVASQNPTDLSQTIFSNAGTLLAFRLQLHEYRESLRQSLQAPSSLTESLERLAVGTALVRFAWDKPGDAAMPFLLDVEGEEPNIPMKIRVDNMDVEIDREDLKKRLWRLGLSDKQIGAVCTSFEGADRTMQAEELARLLTGFGLSRSVILSFLRSLGVADDQLVRLFSRLAARSLGVRPDELVSIEVSHDKKE